MTTYTFKFKDQVFKTTEENSLKMGYASCMEHANFYFDLPQGAWFGNEDNKTIPKYTHEWVLGNFWD